MKIYRQGDLGIIATKTIPDNLKKVYSGDKYILAYGETTGHKHTLIAEPKTDFEILKDEKGLTYLKMNKGATITHEEHKTIPIEKGFYIIHNEREYDYFQKTINQVQD